MRLAASPRSTDPRDYLYWVPVLNLDPRGSAAPVLNLNLNLALNLNLVLALNLRGFAALSSPRLALRRPNGGVEGGGEFVATGFEIEGELGEDGAEVGFEFLFRDDVEVELFLDERGGP